MWPCLVETESNVSMGNTVLLKQKRLVRSSSWREPMRGRRIATVTVMPCIWLGRKAAMQWLCEFVDLDSRIMPCLDFEKKAYFSNGSSKRSSKILWRIPKRGSIHPKRNSKKVLYHHFLSYMSSILRKSLLFENILKNLKIKILKDSESGIKTSVTITLSYQTCLIHFLSCDC